MRVSGAREYFDFSKVNSALVLRLNKKWQCFNL
jgi:hypothetical protein